MTNIKDTTGMIEHLIVHIPSIMKAAPSLKGQARLDIVTCLLTLLHLMSPAHYNILFKHMKQEGLWVNYSFFYYIFFFSIFLFPYLKVFFSN